MSNFWTEEKVDRIQRVVSALKMLDPNYSGFGSNRHQYVFSERASENDLKQFEMKHSMELPKEYRDFLLQLGNGGPGPNYGIEPLEKALHEHDLLKPFPFRKSYENKPDEMYDIMEEQDIEYFDALPGVLSISDGGCDTNDLLVINGPRYGQVWARGYEVWPTFGGFGDYYMKWVDIQESIFIPCYKKGMTYSEISMKYMRINRES